MTIRTDRRFYSVPLDDAPAEVVARGTTDGRWLDLEDAPACAHIVWRALGSTEFIELSTLARVRSRALLREAQVDPSATTDDEGTTAGQQMEQAALAVLVGRRSIVAVVGGPEGLPSPAAYLDTIAPALAVAHGNRAVTATLAPDPFGRAASGR